MSLLPRPNIPEKPVIGYNQYMKLKDSLSMEQMGVIDLRQYFQRKLPSNAFGRAVVEPLMLPHQRKKKLEAMNKKQRENYLEGLHRFNKTGAPKEKPKFRVNKLVKKVATKQTKERKEPSSLRVIRR